VVDLIGMALARGDEPLAMVTGPGEAAADHGGAALHTRVEDREAGSHASVVALAVGLEASVLDRMSSLGVAAERDSGFQPGDRHNFRPPRAAAVVDRLTADSGHVVPIAVQAGSRQHQAGMPAGARPVALEQRRCHEQASLH